MDDFGEYAKPIALLFGEKWSFLDTFTLAASLEMLKMDDFWGKYQAYSLTFW